MDGECVFSWLRCGADREDPTESLREPEINDVLYPWPLVAPSPGEHYPGYSVERDEDECRRLNTTAPYSGGPGQWKLNQQKYQSGTWRSYLYQAYVTQAPPFCSYLIGTVDSGGYRSNLLYEVKGNHENLMDDDDGWKSWAAHNDNGLGRKMRDQVRASGGVPLNYAVATKRTKTLFEGIKSRWARTAGNLRVEYVASPFFLG